MAWPESSVASAFEGTKIKASMSRWWDSLAAFIRFNFKDLVQFGTPVPGLSLYGSRIRNHRGRSFEYRGAEKGSGPEL